MCYCKGLVSVNVSADYNYLVNLFCLAFYCLQLCWFKRHIQRTQQKLIRDRIIVGLAWSDYFKIADTTPEMSFPVDRLCTSVSPNTWLASSSCSCFITRWVWNHQVIFGSILVSDKIQLNVLSVHPTILWAEWSCWLLQLCKEHRNRQVLTSMWTLQFHLTYTARGTSVNRYCWDS